MAQKVLLEVVKALGKAVIAGVGMEIARTVSNRVRDKLGAEKANTSSSASVPVDDLSRMREENAALRREIEVLRAKGDASSVDASTRPHG